VSARVRATRRESGSGAKRRSRNADGRGDDEHGHMIGNRNVIGENVVLADR
jgi:hypothetical protein